MHRFREQWLALLGGVLLLTLSVSAAFGAPPETDEARGQSVSAFVHELVFGEQGDEVDEELTEDELEEDEELEDQELEDEPGVEALVAGAIHGACVAAVAQDPEAVGGANENHGGAVSEAARETCWETEGEGELESESLTDADLDADADEDSAEKANNRGGSDNADAHRPLHAQSGVAHGQGLGQGQGRGGRR